MSPTHKEYVFDFADLKLLSVVCGHCKCETIVDASNASSQMPGACSSCKKTFGTPIWNALSSFVQTYQNVIQAHVGEDATTARIRMRVAK
jgi:Fe-S cluster biogenesis protein NfuA